MLRELLKSKIHRATITDSDVDYEGSIEIDIELMEAVGIVEGEKVLVASISTGARLETYAQEGKRGSGKIIINGGAAHRIGVGEKVAIMSFGYSHDPILPMKVLLNEQNKVVRRGR